MKNFFLLALLSLLALPASAQTISPLVQECGGKKCTGSFTIRNDQLKPSSFVIESYTTKFTNGASRPTPVPLDSGTTATISETSGRLSPKEARVFNFKVTCQSLPCAVTFLTGLSGGHTDDGIQVRLILPFSVYACEKSKGCRLRTLQAAKIIPPEERK